MARDEGRGPWRPWTADRVDLLERLWAQGLSAAQVARRIPGVSRSAVIGKVHRLNLPPRAKDRRPKVAARPPSRRPVAVPPAPPARTTAAALFENDNYVPVPDPVVPTSERRGIVHLGPHDCRWPIGDPLTAEFSFCPRSSVAGLPYCADHARRAYQPPQPRQRPAVASTAGAIGKNRKMPEEV